MQTAQLRNNQWFAAICIALVLAAGTIALYWPVTRDAFINFDDNAYVTDNPHVKAGLTWSGIKWAFTSGYAANWHPLTWISHMVDYQLFGLNSGGHHMMNVLFSHGEYRVAVHSVDFYDRRDVAQRVCGRTLLRGTRCMSKP